MSIRLSPGADTKAYRPSVRKSRPAGFALVALAFLATGCGRDPALDRLDEFAAAAAEAAGRPAPCPAERPLPYPGPAARVLPEADVRVGMLDFFALDRCRAREEIAERNSVLGRLQETGRRLAYEHALLADLEGCLARLVSADEEDDRELAETVARALARLRERLPAVRWNAGFGGSALAASFAAGAGPLPEDPGVAAAQASALGVLADAVAGLGRETGDLDRARIVAAQEALEKGRYWARLHRGLAAAADRLRHAAASLEALASDGCPRRRMQPVLTAYRDAGLGDWLDRLESQGEPWFQALDRLRLASPSPPPGFAAWAASEARADDPRGRWQAFLAARARFAQALALCPTREEGS